MKTKIYNEYEKRKLKWVNTIVIFSPSKEDLDKWGKEIKRQPFKVGESYLCLGEIRNMPEHYIYVDRRGKVYWGWHSDFFVRNDDEV